MEATDLIHLTEKAVEKVKAFADGNKDAEGKHLRVYVQGGGCSGIRYGFAFDNSRDDDQQMEFGGLKVLLDPMSLPYLKGSTVDWIEDSRGAGFVVENPNDTGAEGGGCGCEHSGGGCGSEHSGGGCGESGSSCC